MGSTSEFAKLAQLRAKTDRQLVALIAHQVEHSLSVARSCADRPEQYRAVAEKTYTEARRLISQVYNLNERLRLEARLGELRRTLDGLPPQGGTERYRAACY
jgi:hypothetical protein